MAVIGAFRALRYDFASLGNKLSERLAPPYDVLDGADKEALLRQSERNIVAVDLPHVPAKELGLPECYAAAAAMLRSWCADGTLVRESSPAIYVFHQAFTHGGRDYVRKMILARLRLEPFSAGIVLPHELTFGGPKQDRLALMKATRANLSAVYGLYHDPQDALTRLLAPQVAGPPEGVATLDGVACRVWIVTDEAVVRRAAEWFGPQKVYIADGHHRYTTSLNYRDELRDRAGASWPSDHPANFVMTAFAGMNDPGNLILPTHRVLVALGDFGLDALLQSWGEGTTSANDGVSDITVVEGVTGRRVPLRFTRREVLATLEPSKSAAWRALDLAYLHRYLIDELLIRGRSAQAAPVLRYLKSEADAVDTARRERGLAILCQAATMDELRAVSEAGDVMPQKSTYFYPKVPTGLAIHSLE